LSFAASDQAQIVARLIEADYFMRGLVAAMMIAADFLIFSLDNDRGLGRLPLNRFENVSAFMRLLFRRLDGVGHSHITIAKALLDAFDAVAVL
jgi:hypothetical protein